MQVRHEDLNTRKTAASLNWPIGFGLLTLLALALGANLGAFEGDDINSVVPMLHLQEAIAGDLVIYRYAWQPLSYQLGAAILSVTGHPDWVYLCAPLAAAVTLTLILITIQKQARRTHPAWVFPALLFLLPELFFSGLYFNSTILGLPFLAAATLLILSGSERLWRMLTAGLLAGVAILMRIDFVLACPMLAAIAFGTGNRIRQPLAIAAGVMTMLVFGLVSGLLDLPAMIEVYRTSSEEIAQKSNQPGWNLHTKLWVASAALHPLGYLLSGASAALLPRVKVRPRARLLASPNARLRAMQRARARPRAAVTSAAKRGRRGRKAAVLLRAVGIKSLPGHECPLFPMRKPCQLRKPPISHDLAVFRAFSAAAPAGFAASTAKSGLG